MTATTRLAQPPQSVVWRLARALALLAWAGLFALPLLLAVGLALDEARSALAWQAVLSQPQLPRAAALSVFTAVVSTGLALAFTMAVVMRWQAGPAWAVLRRGLAPLLAVPHAAFAIGLAWLVAPAGWLARALAPLLGWVEPPAWETVNDAHGLLLVAVLVLKETPYLLWSVAALLARPEAAAAAQRQQAVARTLGYPPAQWWAWVGWGQWLPALAWPLAAVLAYGLTVVDVALLVGPGSPPTLAVLAWQALSDASVERNAQGAVMALMLSLALAGLMAIGVALHGLWQGSVGWRATQGLRWVSLSGRFWPPLALVPSLAVLGVALYGAALLALAVWSIAGPWRFPLLLPGQWTLNTWNQVQQALATVGFSVLLGGAAAASAVVLAVAWLEAAPVRWDRRVTPLVLLPLVLPQLLWLAGLYRLALWAELDGSAWALWWVHGLVVLPYVTTALAPAWRGFDPRYEHTALALGRARLVFWWQVKWPLLAAPLASALAIGFAVSMAQYLSTQFIGAARHPTLTTEAVTLSSGGQRNLGSAFALLQALLPLLGFALAQGVARRTMRRHGP